MSCPHTYIDKEVQRHTGLYARYHMHMLNAHLRASTETKILLRLEN